MGANSHLRIPFLVEAPLVLKVEAVTVVIVLQNIVGGRSAEKVTIGVEVALPVLLHHAVHDMRLHHWEGVKVLEIVQHVTIHQVDLPDLEPDLIGEEEAVEHRFGLVEDLIGEVRRPQDCHRVLLLNVGKDHEHVHGCLHGVQVAQQVGVAAIFFHLAKALFH